MGAEMVSATFVNIRVKAMLMRSVLPSLEGLVRPGRAIEAARPRIVRKVSRQGALVVSIERGDERAPIPEQMGPIAVSYIEAKGMPGIRGNDRRTKIVFAIAR